MAEYHDFAGPHRLDKRKSDKYMPYEAFVASARDHARGRIGDDRYVSDGRDAAPRAIEDASRGILNEAEISCLRGLLRQKVVGFAQAVWIARQKLDAVAEQKAEQEFLRAVTCFEIDIEEKAGVWVWRLRMPNSGNVDE